MSKQQEKSVSKEIKIIARPVITVESIKDDRRKLILLNIIKYLNEVSEKGLQYLVNWLQTDKNLQLKYEFITIGNIPASKQLKDDVNILLYLGLIETNPVSRKLRLTTAGSEFIEKYNLSSDELKQILSMVEELKQKLKPIEAEVELTSKSIRGRR